MKFISAEQSKSVRKKHNDNVIKRMIEGDPLQTHDAFSSWYPPRPVIAKDHDAISKLYKLDPDEPASKTELGILRILDKNTKNK